MHPAQTKARSDTIALRCKERLEYFLQDIGGHPGARIGNGERQDLTREPVIVGSILQVSVPCLYRQSPRSCIAYLALIARLGIADRAVLPNPGVNSVLPA